MVQGGTDRGTCGGVPDPRRPVEAGRHHALPVRAELDMDDGTRVRQARDPSSCGGVPDAGGAVFAGRGDAPLIRAECGVQALRAMGKQGQRPRLGVCVRRCRAEDAGTQVLAREAEFSGDQQAAAVPAVGDAVGDKAAAQRAGTDVGQTVVPRDADLKTDVVARDDGDRLPIRGEGDARPTRFAPLVAAQDDRRGATGPAVPADVPDGEGAAPDCGNPPPVPAPGDAGRLQPPVRLGQALLGGGVQRPQRPQQAARSQVPHAGAIVLAAGHQARPVRAEGRVGDPTRVCHRQRQYFPRRRLPHTA